MVRGRKWENDSSITYIEKGEIPAMFSDLLEARNSLVSHWHMDSYSTSDTWIAAIENIPAIPQAGVWEKRSGGILARWSSAYDAYLNIQGNNLTYDKRKGTASLRILKELGTISTMLTRTEAEDEISWDIFCPTFQKVVSLAENIVEIDLKSTADRPTLCINMALVEPLFKVSSFENTILVRILYKSYQID